MRIRTDRDGNTSFGREMLTADGKGVHDGRCEKCRAELSAVEMRLEQKMCSACVERQVPGES